MTAIQEDVLRDIMRVLCRIPVSPRQLVLYHLACEHQERGFTSTQVKELSGLDQSQHRGLMSALTNRINNTPRETSTNAKPGLGLLFVATWDGRENTYRPTPELLGAIGRLPALDAIAQQPIEEVLQAEPLVLSLPAGVDAKPAPPTKPATIATTKEAPANPFDALLDALDAADLVYPTELVANLLLALQVKRFVILTGISGTGKTRIAQALADRFSIRRRVEARSDPGELGALITVKPYMRKYHRMMLPQALALQLPTLLEKDGSGTLPTKWPGGEIELRVWTNPGLAVLFRGELRKWFDATFQEGDLFLAELEISDGTPDTLVLSPAPKASMSEQLVTNTVVMAVRPDWIDHRGLLGAYNPLTRQYLTTPFLRLLLEAKAEHGLATKEQRPAEPFFLILDEMNLARVEHYFADFLSALESGSPLHLHDSAEVEEGLLEDDEQHTPVPRELLVPPNVFFIGTVNVDESTYLFSPKVLDRAFTIELNGVDLDGLSTGLDRGGELVLAQWDGRLAPPKRPGREDWRWLGELEDGALIAHVRAFHALLANHNRHFGYRVATELARFVHLAARQSKEPGPAAWAALDLALLQKVLVKLHGTRHELTGILETLLRFTLVGAGTDNELSELALWTYWPELGVVQRKDEAADMDALFPRSAAKLWRMRDRLRETGFTSWIE